MSSPYRDEGKKPNLDQDKTPLAVDHAAEAALDRLEASFGREALNALLADLVTTLTEAVGALDRGEMDVKVAHQVAGITGTLGFATASAAWLALSHGTPSAAVTAHYEARRALATLAAR